MVRRCHCMGPLVFSRSNASYHSNANPPRGDECILHIQNAVYVQYYLGWLAKLGGRGGSNMGTSSELWRAAVFPFAILQILVNLTNYEISKRAYIIDQQYKDNMTHEWLSAASWVPFVNSTN